MVLPVSHYAASYALKIQVFWYMKQLQSISNYR